MTTTSKYDILGPLLDTDGYKIDHRRQYPEKTTVVFSNFTNRGSRIDGIDGVVAFGLQAFLQKWAIDAWDIFFEADEDEVAATYEEFNAAYLGPNNIGVDHIRSLHRLGYLPLEFSAVPEGTVVPLRVPSLTVTNTEPEFFWLVNFIETALSASIWQPSTTATLAYRLRKLLDEAAVRTNGSTAGVEFQAHDFSFRGMAGIEAASASGAGHLTSFLGTDSLPSIRWIDRYYPGDNGWVGASVPATEHAVMCAGGSDEGDEENTYRHILNLYPEGIVSVVSDTWDLWNVLTVILPNLKDDILARNGKLVIRPDSGNPVDILTGSVHTNPNSSKPFRELWELSRKTGVMYGKEGGGPIKPSQIGVIELLWDVFGGTVNEQGYKVLDSHIGAIYGDSITFERAQEIIKRLEAKGFASTNVVFGVGSFSYQYQTRDTFGSAMKATYVVIDGEGKAIFKNPVTDNGLKKSAKGLLGVFPDENGKLTLHDNLTEEEFALTGPRDALQPVWIDGKFVTKQSFADVRATLLKQ